MTMKEFNVYKISWALISVSNIIRGWTNTNIDEVISSVVTKFMFHAV